MSVNDRVCFNSSIGTIRYSGNIPGKAGIWYGIEWDDPSRGKGDGSVNGVRYFTSKSSTGASFLKATAPSLQRGRTFLEALREKYIESTHDDGVESIILGSSDGAIEVEAVNMNKVRGKFARLETLKEVGLESYMINSAGNPGEVAATCPNIRRLDLSRNLLSSWEEVVAIATQLRHLESLALHGNVFRTLESPLAGDCKSVTELRLSRTGINWAQSLFVSAAFPSLVTLEIGYNELASLDAPASISAPQILSHLVTLNLDADNFSDWGHLMHVLKPLSGLQSLFISDNQLNVIPKPSSNDSPLSSVTTLFLDGNPLSRWSCIDAIVAWLPNVSNLRVSDTPLMTDPETSKYARQILIGRIASIQRLNSSQITEQERRDSEIFYLNWIARNTKPEERISSHPRWEKLVELYGLPEEEKPTVDTSRLRNRLISVDVYLLAGDPSKRSVASTKADFKETVQILPKMPIKAFRLKLIKSLKAKPNSHIRVFVKLRKDEKDQGVWGEIELDSSRQLDLDWYGVEDGGHLGILLEA